LAHCQIRWFKDWAIRRFIRKYSVDTEQALHRDVAHYRSFQDFFIRQLQPDARPIAPEGICSPCDGTISQIGRIAQGSLLQAKGHTFSLDALLADKAMAAQFTNGHFLTIYLAPKDYHRVHMPCEGVVDQLRYVPGKLFSVNTLTAEHVENLFARNERAVALFDHAQAPFAMVLVGAMIVGNITTRWGGTLLPHRRTGTTHIHYEKTPAQRIKLDKGEEMGYFSLGSTVILLFPENIAWEETLTEQTPLQLGQRIGRFL